MCHTANLKLSSGGKKNRTGLTFCVAGRQLGPGFLTPRMAQAFWAGAPISFVQGQVKQMEDRCSGSIRLSKASAHLCSWWWETSPGGRWAAHLSSYIIEALSLLIWGSCGTVNTSSYSHHPVGNRGTRNNPGCCSECCLSHSNKLSAAPN